MHLYYLYTLSYKGDIFYVGISKDPEARYKQHCGYIGNAGLSPSEFIHWIIENNELPNLTIVNHFNAKSAALIAEYSLIKYFVSINHKLCNLDPNPIYNQRITCRPPYNSRRKRQPNNYTKFIKDILIKYHKENDHQHRYHYMGNTTSPRI